jgi:hypothetical protein
MTASSFDVVTGCFLSFFLFVSINIFKFIFLSSATAYCSTERIQEPHSLF